MSASTVLRDSYSKQRIMVVSGHGERRDHIHVLIGNLVNVIFGTLRLVMNDLNNLWAGHAAPASLYLIQDL